MIIQRTPEWFAIRAGKLTASRIADATAKTKTGYSASRANLIATLVCERLTGQPQETYTNAAMQWGIEKEPEARDLYALMTNADVTEIGFVAHPTIAMCGASPDGLVGEDGLVEIKCPNSAGHIETLLSETFDGKYIKQVQFQMACTGRAWTDLVSYDPRLPGDMQIFIKRIPRDPKFIAELEAEAVSFLSDVEAKVQALTAKFGAMEAA